MKAQYISIIAALFILTGCQNSAIPTETAPPTWEEVSSGLSHREVTAEGKDMVIVRIDPQQYEFSIYQNTDQATAKTIEEVHQEQGSLLTFNGQFFTEKFQPTGMLISGGQKLRGHSEANLLNGIIAIDQRGSVRFLEYAYDLDEKKYPFAIQNGPILINRRGNIKIEGNSDKTASRTALGLDNKGNLILIILKQSILNFDNKISLYELAHLLKENVEFAPLKLHSVLNLDGGTSTGMIIDEKYYPEMEKVQNLILVKKR